MIEPSNEMRAAFLADHEDACDGVGCGRQACLDVRLAAVLAIVERDLGLVGPCSVSLSDFFDREFATSCELRHGHTGDHEAGPTRWREMP